MDHGIMSMPDEMFDNKKPGSFSDVIQGYHSEVLMHLQPAQTQQLIDFMKRSGVFFNDNYSDGLDSPNDILEHMNKLKPQQYAEYVMLIGSFDGPDEDM